MKSSDKNETINNDVVYNDITFVDITDDFIMTLENLVIRYNELNNGKNRIFYEENYDNYLINYVIKMIE